MGVRLIPFSRIAIPGDQKSSVGDHFLLAVGIPHAIRSTESDSHRCCRYATSTRIGLKNFFGIELADINDCNEWEQWLPGNDVFAGRLRGRVVQALLTLAAILVGSVAAAQVSGDNPVSSFTQSFDESPAWQLLTPAAASVESRARLASDEQGTGRIAVIDLLAADATADIRAICPVSPALVFGELRCSLRVRTTCPNVRLALRIIFPRQIDPRTGRMLEAELVGERYTDRGQWQTLVCATTDAAFEGLLIRLRGQLVDGVNVTSLDAREAYVSAAVLLFDGPPGESSVLTDDLQLAPIVAPSPGLLPQEPLAANLKPRIQMADDRILLDGQPFFPRFTPYHGEQPATLANADLNMVWISDHEDTALLDALAQQGLGAIAQPPRITRDAEQLGREALVPFTAQTAGIWAWMLGQGIPESESRFISHWTTAVQDADRQLRRPILADVEGSERHFHRFVSMLGGSEQTMQTAINPLDAVRRFHARQNAGLPGKPMFAFIMTEPADVRLDALSAEGPLPVLEPEQILLQGHMALAAGYKGIGFSKHVPLDASTPGTAGLDERLFAIKLLNLQIKVLEPWLSTGRLVQQLDARVGEDAFRGNRRGIGSSPLASKWDTTMSASPQPHQQADVRKPAAGESLPVRASMFQTDYGYLILFVGYEPGAQFVPGAGQAEHVRVLITGDAVQGWEVTSTDVATSNLEMKHESGGTEIHLKKFDRFAAVVIPRDGQAIDLLKRQLRESRPAVAETSLKLAELKLERVRRVHAELVEMRTAPVPEAERWLQAADQTLKLARRELANQHYTDTQEYCMASLSFCRRLQRQHWERAQEPLASPLASPWSVAFQTLPQHWRLVEELSRRSRTSENLLPSGDFENHAELESTWSYESSSKAGQLGMEPSVELVRQAAQGSHALAVTLPSPQLPGPPLSLSEPPWTMISPEVPYRQGEMLFVSGRISVPAQLDSMTGGLAVYDSILGRSAGLSFTQATNGWERFYLIREAPADGLLKLHFEMNSPGTVVLDDLQVLTLSRHQTQPAGGQETAP